MFNIEITPLVKTEIRPVPEAQLLDQLYRIFLDKGVHFRVEQVNDESIVFYWTHSNDYLCDTIAKEIGELLNPVETAETEQPKAEVEKQQWPINNGNKPYSLWYDGRKGKEIKETLGALYPDFLNFYWDGDKIIVQMKNFDQKIIEEIRSIAELIDNDAVRLIWVRDIGKEDADEIMRGAVHEYKGKIRGSNYVDGTLTVLVDNDPDVIKWFEEPYSFTYTGPEAEAINDTLTAFYPTKVETKLEGEKLTIKWKWWDAALDEEISNLINEIVDNRLRLLTINTIGEEDADAFMGGILRTFPEKVRQWTYNDDTLIILLNYEPGLIENLERRLEDLSLKRFLKDGARSVLKGLFSDCNCPICQKHR
ncbi:hypothetical protein QR510_25445 [Escherichia coli]|uniref:hypothetical protein n=1 Tax=Escherichia coli TaxID=562 RepID=UPI002738E12D|nr:hypothetical protein [Escherichia coli]MDP4359990.1 hypothetical protein [Escherichia coli]